VINLHGNSPHLPTTLAVETRLPPSRASAFLGEVDEDPLTDRSDTGAVLARIRRLLRRATAVRAPEARHRPVIGRSSRISPPPARAVQNHFARQPGPAEQPVPIIRSLTYRLG
jgi:hypothetical protein